VEGQASVTFIAGVPSCGRTCALEWQTILMWC